MSTHPTETVPAWRFEMKPTRKGHASPAVVVTLTLLTPALGYPASTGPETDYGLFFQQIDLSFAAASGLNVAVSYVPTLGFFNRRLNIGVGPRFSSLFGQNGAVYQTIQSGQHDTLTVDQARFFALNLMFTASVRLIAGLEVGMNIDLVGVGFGPGVTGQYVSLDPTLVGAQTASPSHLDLLLFGSRDYGQLDSEFFAAYWFDSAYWFHSWGIRVGASHMRTEYTTDRPLEGNNDRFSLAVTRVFIAFGLRF
jgi:hypothetical protein